METIESTVDNGNDNGARHLRRPIRARVSTTIYEIGHIVKRERDQRSGDTRKSTDISEYVIIR